MSILSSTCCCLRARRVKYRRASSNRFTTRIGNCHVRFLKNVGNRSSDRQGSWTFCQLFLQNMIYFLRRVLPSGKAKYVRSGLLWVPFRQTATAQYLTIAISSRKVQKTKIKLWNIKSIWFDLIFALFVLLKTSAVFPGASLWWNKFDTSLPRYNISKLGYWSDIITKRQMKYSEVNRLRSIEIPSKRLKKDTGTQVNNSSFIFIADKLCGFPVRPLMGWVDSPFNRDASIPLCHWP